MSILLLVVVLLVTVILLSRLTWSWLWGERRSIKRHERAMDVLGSLSGRQPGPRAKPGKTGVRGDVQVCSSVSDPSWPEGAVVGDPVEAARTERDVRQLDVSAAEMAAALEITLLTGSPMPTDEDRPGGGDLDPVIRNEVTAPMRQGRNPRRIVSGLVGYLVASGKIRPRSERRTPLLAGALVVLALSALCGALIAGLVTAPNRRPPTANSPTTAPVAAPPAPAPITPPPTTTPITASPAAVPVTPPPTTTPITPPATTTPISAPPAAVPVTRRPTTAQVNVPVVAPIHVPGVPPIHVPGVPPIHVPRVPPINVPGVPPVNVPGVPPVNVPGVPPIHVPGVTP